MLIFDSIIDSIKSLLKDYISDSLAEIRVSYEKGIIPNPIRKTYIILNPSRITVAPDRDEEGYGLNIKKTTYIIGINIHRSETSDPKKLLKIFSDIVNAFDESPLYKLDEAVCGEIKSDSDTNSICLKSTVQFTIKSS